MPNLTRNELVRARDAQLSAIGFTRRKNAGWLKKALETQFSADQIASFHAAFVPRKKQTPIYAETVKTIRQQFAHLLASVKAGEKIAAIDHARAILDALQKP